MTEGGLIATQANVLTSLIADYNGLGGRWGRDNVEE